jgi:hypothetical protein
MKARPDPCIKLSRALHRPSGSGGGSGAIGAPEGAVQARLGVRARVSREGISRRRLRRHSLRAVNGAECNAATSTGDGERVFVTAQRGLADFAL